MPHPWLSVASRRTRRLLMAGLTALSLLPLASGARGSDDTSSSARREIGSLVMEGVPDLPPDLVDRMRPYQNTRSATVYDWDPEGRGLLIGTRFGDTSQVHQVGRPGGDRQQITFYAEPINGATTCPAPAAHGFLFSKDVGGAENYQIFLRDLKTGTTTLMTDGTSRNIGPVWSNKGDRFAWAGNARNGRDMDIYVADPNAPEAAKRVLEREGSWAVLDWSADDASILVKREVSVNESALYVLGVADGKLEQVNPKPGAISYGDAVFARKGRGLYFASDEGSEFLRLRYYDLAAKTTTDLTADVPWDVESIALTRTGDRLAFTTNEGGTSRLTLVATSTRAKSRPAGIPEGIVSRLRFAPDGTRLAFTLDSATIPGDAYVLDLKYNAVTRWTDSEVGGLDASGFIAPETIDYPTFDQVNGAPRRVPALLYQPKGTGPHPVLVIIHGGPEGQSRPGFSATTQFYLRELGIAVILPNVRGSTGYGKTYTTLDNGAKREDSVRDIGSLLDWIGTRPDLDAKRVAVFGGSYGGYMVLACLTHYSDRLRAGIEIVGISNFVTFLKSTSGYRQDLRRVEYGDERDPKMLETLQQISPLNSVDRIRTPIFIAQGKNDPRVPMTESEQMLQAVKKNGVPAWYLLAKDEGHGFKKKPNVDFYGSAVALFLETNLLEPGAAQGGR
jgi:dipeptidyl aminopeptidase/acylaminoacyl peptidase